MKKLDTILCVGCNHEFYEVHKVSIGKDVRDSFFLCEECYIAVYEGK